jgi:hypothetical protein
MSNRLTERAQTSTGGGGGAVDIASWGGVAVAPAAPKADGQSAALIVPEFGARQQVFNGATWDPARAGFVGPVTGPFLGYQNVLPMGVFNAVAPVLVDGQAVTLQFDANGQLKTSGGGGGASIGLVGAPVPLSANYTGFIDAAGNLQGARVYDLDTGIGVEDVLGINLRLSAGGGSIEALGQMLSASSIPVVLASDQSNIPVTATQGAAAGAAGPWSVRLSDGAAFYDGTKTGQLPAALVGGRLDENVGAWLGSTAPTVGQKTMVDSLPVAIASDQSAIPVTGTVTNNPAQPANSAVTSVASSAVSVTLLAANANRKGAMITNDGTANLFVKLGAVASATSYTAKLIPGAYYEVPPPVYTGVIDGIWDVAVGNARVTETTP